MTVVLGLDLSLTATGVALPDGTSVTLSPKDRGMERLAWIRSLVMELAKPVDIIAIEGYSFGSRVSHAHALGELGGIIRFALWSEGIVYVDVPPACVKKYATGKGNASKDQVLSSAVHRMGREFHDNNQADAAWLRAMTLDQLGTPEITMPAAHRAALNAVTWPITEGALDR